MFRIMAIKIQIAIFYNDFEINLINRRHEESFEQESPEKTPASLDSVNERLDNIIIPDQINKVRNHEEIT